MTVTQKQRQAYSYYCAGPIRGDSSFVRFMSMIVKIVEKYGEPYTERSDTYGLLENFAKDQERVAKEKQVYQRDIRWLRESKAVIAEVSGASTGTGIEIQQALNMRKPVLCLYH